MDDPWQSAREWRRHAIAALAGTVAVIASVQVSAQDAPYPSKPIRIVVAFAPGGVADTVARVVGQRLSERLGQGVVVENRGGAGGNVASKAVGAAAADGYTLLAHTAAVAVNSALGPQTGYDPLAELGPVALAASTPTIIVGNAASPARDLREFVQGAKGKRASYSSAGVGTSPHLTADYVLRVLSGLDAVHVPYQGGPLAITAVIAGQVDLVSTSMPPALPHVRQGKLRALAVADARRTPALPDVPTLAELGIANFEDVGWIAFLAPLRTPEGIVSRLNQEIRDTLQQPDVRERLTNAGFEPQQRTVAEFATYLRSETAKWTQVVKAIDFKP